MFSLSGGVGRDRGESRGRSASESATLTRLADLRHPTKCLGGGAESGGTTTSTEGLDVQLIGVEVGPCEDGQGEEGCGPRRTNRGGEVVVRVGGGETVRGEMELERERREGEEKRSRCATASGGEWFGETPRRGRSPGNVNRKKHFCGNEIENVLKNHSL